MGRQLRDLRVQHIVNVLLTPLLKVAAYALRPEVSLANKP